MSLLTWLFGPREVVRPDTCADYGPHEDDLIDKHDIPSGFEQMDPPTRRRLERLPDTLWVKKVIFTFKCKKCGRVMQKECSNAEELQDT